MRRLLTVCGSLLLLASCARHAPEADEFELADEFDGLVFDRHLADAELNEPAPWLEFRRTRSDPEVVVCPFEVVAHRFPAVRWDGAEVVHVTTHVDGNADRDAEYMLLTTTSVGVDEPAAARGIYDRNEHDIDDCRAAMRRVKASVTEVNEMLARERWRPMTRLPVQITDSGPYADIRSPDDFHVRRRAVQVGYDRKAFVVRTRQRELERQPRADWIGKDEFCDDVPHLSNVWADWQTGAAVVTYDHSNGGCLCDDHEYHAVLRLPEGVFDAIGPAVGHGEGPGHGHGAGGL